jgi:CO/xanthine dehydrogenase FAD-binding subunit
MMKPAPFRYERAETLEDALSFLGKDGERSKVLAGGQSLVALMNLRLARPEIILDIGPLDELRFVRRGDGGLRVGAMTTQTELALDLETGTSAPLLAEAIPYIGHAAIRNRGTIGGSVAHADSSAELPLVLVATEGLVTVQSRANERTIPAEDFFRGFLTTAAAPDELVTSITFPLIEADGVAFEEFARRPGDFALVSVAVVTRRDADAVSSARIVVGGVGPTPHVVDSSEELVGLTAGEAVAKAPDLVDASIAPVSDMHGSEAYRRHLTRELVAQAIGRALTG